MTAPILSMRALMAPVRDALSEDGAFRHWLAGSEFLGPDDEPLLLFRGLSRPYDDDIAQRMPYQSFTDDLASAIAYAAPGNHREDDQPCPEAPCIVVAALAVRAPYLAQFHDQAEALARLQGFEIDPSMGYRDAVTPETPGALSRDGYDGILLDDGTGARDHVTYVAFRPDQVRVLAVVPLPDGAWLDPGAAAPQCAQRLVEAALQGLPHHDAEMTPRQSRGIRW